MTTQPEREGMTEERAREIIESHAGMNCLCDEAHNKRHAEAKGYLERVEQERAKASTEGNREIAREIIFRAVDNSPIDPKISWPRRHAIRAALGEAIAAALDAKDLSIQQIKLDLEKETLKRIEDAVGHYRREVERLKQDLALRGEGYDPEKTASVGRRFAEYLSRIRQLESDLTAERAERKRGEEEKKELISALETGRPECICLGIGSMAYIKCGQCQLIAKAKEGEKTVCKHENGTWFDRSVSYTPDGREEGMFDRCNDCGEILEGESK